MQRPTHRLRLSEIGPHVKCVLCLGYLIDATTIVECLHSFCRSCLLNYLSNNNIFCPICDVQIHKTNPLLSIKPDKTLQDIVYKLVPGLFRSEMRQRRLFYAKHPQKSRLVSPEERGVGAERVIYSPDDTFSLSMEYYDTEREREERENSSSHSSESSNTDSTLTTEGVAAASPLKRYLQCPALVTIGILKKFIRMKFDLTCAHRVEIFHRRVSLANEYTLMDVAYIYTWKGSDPMRFFYRISEVSDTCVPTPLCPVPAELKTESQTADRPLTAVPSTSKEPDAKPSTSTERLPTLPKPSLSPSVGSNPLAIQPASLNATLPSESKTSLTKAADPKPSVARTAATEPKQAKVVEAKPSTSRASHREATKPASKPRPSEIQSGKTGKVANDRTPEVAEKADRRPANCVGSIEGGAKDRRQNRAASDSSDSGPVVDKKALFNSLKLKRCSEPVTVATVKEESRKEEAGPNSIGMVSSAKGPFSSAKGTASSTMGAASNTPGVSSSTIGASSRAKEAVSSAVGASPSSKEPPNAAGASPGSKGAALSMKETVPSSTGVAPSAVRAGHSSSGAGPPSSRTPPAISSAAASATTTTAQSNMAPGPSKIATTSRAPTSTTATSIGITATPTNSTSMGSNSIATGSHPVGAGSNAVGTSSSVVGATTTGPTASVAPKKPHQQILTNNEEIIKAPTRRPAVATMMPGEVLKRKLAALEMSQRRPPGPAKRPRLALKPVAGPSVQKPGPSVPKPGPTLQKPGPVVQKPGPSVQKQSPTVPKPGPAVQKPGPSVQKQSPTVPKPGPAVQKPGPSVQKQSPTVQKPGPASQKPGIVSTKVGPVTLAKPGTNLPAGKPVSGPSPSKPSPPAVHKNLPASVPMPGHLGAPKVSSVAPAKQPIAVGTEKPSTSSSSEKLGETAPRPPTNEHRSDADKQRASTNQRTEVEKLRVSLNQPRPEVEKQQTVTSPQKGEVEKPRPLTIQPKGDAEKPQTSMNQPRPEMEKPRPSTNQPRADTEKTATWTGRQQPDVVKAQPIKSEPDRPSSQSGDAAGSQRLQAEAKAKPANDASGVSDRLSAANAEKGAGTEVSEAGPSRLGKSPANRNHTTSKPRTDAEKVTSPLPQLIEIPKPRQDRTGALDLTARPSKSPRPSKPFAFPHPLKIPNLSRLPTPPPPKARREEPTYPPAELSRIASPLRDHRRGGSSAGGAGPSAGRAPDDAAALRQRLEMQARLWGAGTVPPEWFHLQDPAYVKHFETLLKSLAGSSPPPNNAAATAAKKLNR